MSQTTRWLSLVLIGAAALAAYLFYAGADERNEESTRAAASTQFAAQWSAIATAEKIDDAGARCVAYPDMPGLHWKPELLAVMCRWQSYRFVTQAEIREALDKHELARLDDIFQSYLDQHYADHARHGIIHRAYASLFSNASAETRALAEKWAELSPHSAYALAARGTYELAAAWVARGEDYVAQTPQANMDTMTALMRRAHADLLAALQINPRLIWAYSQLIRISEAVGDRDLLESSVDAALKLDPADERIFLDWMTASQPRWGGSAQAMEAVAARARQHVAENPYLLLLDEKPLSERARILHQHHDPAGALKLYDQALAIAPSGFDFYEAGMAAYEAHDLQRAVLYFSQSYRFGNGFEGLSRRVYCLVEMGRTDLARQSLNDRMISHETSPQGMNDVASALLFLHRAPEAEALLLRVLVLNPRDRDALERLSYLYLDSHPRQMEKAQPLIATLTTTYPNYARGWLLSGVGKPDKECHEALRKYLDLVDPNDSYERENIAMAKKRLSELESSEKGKAGN